MLYVLARSEHDFRVWLHATGLPPKVVRSIASPNACRGVRLDYRDVVRLDGFYLNPKADEITTMLIPCGIQPSKVVAARHPL